MELFLTYLFPVAFPNEHLIPKCQSVLARRVVSQLKHTTPTITTLIKAMYYA